MMLMLVGAEIGIFDAYRASIETNEAVQICVILVPTLATLGLAGKFFCGR